MNSRVAKAGGCLVLSLALGLFAACGDDDSGDIGTDGGAGKAGESSGGKGGKGGAGGSSGKGGSGGAGSGGSVTCGGETCTVNSTLLQLAPSSKPCCTEDDKCGQPTTSGKCLLKNAPGVKDASCPPITVKAAGMSFPQEGCCTPHGQCGGNYTIVEFGCVAREDVEKDFGGPLMPIPCGSDSGALDAGN
ncbi:MAG TPA: hypothetical protein VJV78_37455 [Polyangiales bacterium]|nr:hypothetical protein [Polyangiales bacterium]